MAARRDPGANPTRYFASFTQKRFKAMLDEWIEQWQDIATRYQELHDALPPEAHLAPDAHTPSIATQIRAGYEHATILLTHLTWALSYADAISLTDRERMVKIRMPVDQLLREIDEALGARPPGDDNPLLQSLAAPETDNGLREACERIVAQTFAAKKQRSKAERPKRAAERAARYEARQLSIVPSTDAPVSTPIPV